MPAESFQQHYSSLKSAVEHALRETLARQEWPASLTNAVEYSLMAGGKRLRPVLVLLSADVCGGATSQAVPAACAIEMVHTYSLIHDDLPSMDDDDLRRGRPTSHVVFGEALAILAGDALLTLAFETLAAADTSGVSSGVTAECLSLLARAAGGQGMVGGQILDLEAERGPFARADRSLMGRNAETTENREVGEKTGFSGGRSASGRIIGANSRVISPDAAVSRDTDAADSTIAASDLPPIHVEQLVRIHRMKTGALMTAALRLGAAVASATPEQQFRLQRFGECIGLAFQIADDLLDVTGSHERLGKETGRDNELGKLTYPSLIGIEASRSKAQSLVDDACAALDVFDDRADSLRQLARFIVERDH